MLNSKKRLAVLVLGMLVLIVPASVNQILIVANSPLNRTDIQLFQEGTTIQYDYNDGTYKHSSELSMEITPPADQEGLTQVEGTFGEESFSFQCDYETGRYVEDGSVSDYYTLFWIDIKNPMLHAGDFEKTEEFNVIDPIGMLGQKGDTYTLRVGEKKVYWDVNPKLSGAQFSFVINIYDESDQKVADGLMDSTCGFLEILEGGDNNARFTIVDPGSYAISRNRNNILLFGLIIGVAIPCITYVFLRMKDVDKREREEMTLLVAVGASVVIVDIIIDVWFYAWLGQTPMILLHLALFIVYALICLRLKYGIKWALPAFLEVAFVFAMTNFVGDPYIPHITAFMGLYASYLAMLFRSGIDKQEYDDKIDIFI